MYFTIVLFLVTLFTGVIWILEKIFSRLQHRTHAQFVFSGSTNQSLHRSSWFKSFANLFPSIFLVFCVRSFFVEPFKIPSSSMKPTLCSGDFILVNKLSYGIQLPIIHRKLMQIGRPQRGDIVVFQYPYNTSLNYIKRIIGLPGETVKLKNKKLYINELPVATKRLKDVYDEERSNYVRQYEEQIGKKSYTVIQSGFQQPVYRPILNFPFQENCFIDVNEIVCKVPKGYYFVLGDNRDNSLDSRYWGFVPEKNLIGRAFFIWFNRSKLLRIGKLN